MSYTIEYIESAQQIEDEVDFEYLFAEAEEYMEMHATLPAHLETREAKMKYVKGIFGQFCERDGFIVYHVQNEDGSLLLMLAKVIDGDTWQYEFTLLGRDINGSKAWIHSEEFTGLMNDFRDEAGVVNIAVRDWKTGTSKNYFNKRFDVDLTADKSGEDDLTETHVKRIR